jgi:RHH-type rel operon transcriptional repressor/antitoxin RelB
MQKMLTFRVPAALDKQLEKLARRTGRSKSFYAKRALVEFLEEHKDYLIAVSRLEDDLPSIPLSEVVKRLGLDR